MSGAELEGKLRNGFGARVAASVLAGLLLAAIATTYTVTKQLTRIEERMQSLSERYERRVVENRRVLTEIKSDIDDLEERIRKTERAIP